MKTMKAVRLIAAGKPLELREVPIPEIGENDILVKIKAAGICHSDAHYRAGISSKMQLPHTLGHEVAGIVEKTGSAVKFINEGDRVALHYLVTCENCEYCLSGNEQFCPDAKMIGHQLPGGYAEYIAVPARNAIRLPESISFEAGATLMCASATAYHSLLKARIKYGDKVAVFGAGGLGQSAVQLAIALGASEVYIVDIDDSKLDIASGYGAVSINSKEHNPVEEIKNLSGGRGVDVALEMVGLPVTQKQALESVGPMGRVVLVGLSDKSILINTYKEILGNEVELIGSNDHNLHELPRLIEFVEAGKLDTSHIVSRTVPLDASMINEVLDKLERHESGGVRTVIVPE